MVRAPWPRSSSRRMISALRLRGGQAVERAGMDGKAFAGEALQRLAAGLPPKPRRLRRHHLADGQRECAREFPVALVVRRHGHDRAGAVAEQHVVRDPDRDALAVHRIDRKGAGEDAGLFLGEFGALEVALARGAFPILLARRAIAPRSRFARPAGAPARAPCRWRRRAYRAAW